VLSARSRSSVATLGPRNTELPSDRLQHVTAAFANAGIAEFATTRALEIILHANPESSVRIRRQQYDPDYIRELAHMIEDEAE
jgi:hypothetical protein